MKKISKEEFLKENIYKGLTNLNIGFDAPSIYYFSAEDFKIVLQRVEQFGIGIKGIEPWKDGEYYDSRVCEEFDKESSNPKWYNKAFKQFLDRGDEPLQYAASYDVPRYENALTPSLESLTNILYIHGFNSGKGGKVTALEQEGYNVYCPQLTNNILEDITTLRQYITDNEIEHVIGCSLGGFYALVLSNEFDEVHFHMINPSYKPYKTLRRHLNTTLKNYKTGVEFTVTDNFLEELKKLDVSLKESKLSELSFYFGTEDEVLNFEELKTMLYNFKRPLNIVKEKQDHRFKDISCVIERIKKLEVLN
jgi:predicted esterase YcpF (UPF0227 family)